MEAAVNLLHRRGEALFRACFVIGLAAIVLAAIMGHPFVPLALIAGLLLIPPLVWLFSRDHRALAALVVGFAVTARYAEGFQLEEVAYSVAFFGFIGTWFARKITFDPEALLRSWIDLFLLLYLVYATFSLSISIINGAEISKMVSEYYALLGLAIYFPLKEVFAHSVERSKLLLYALLGLAVIIALRNFWWYFMRLNSADHLWQLATGRIVMNEHILLPSAVAAILLYLNERSVRLKIVLFGISAVIISGIIIGQSRALWLAFFLALVVVFLFSGKREKRSLLKTAGMGVFALASISYIILGSELFTLIVAGILDRFFSLESAVTEDISLVNRFLEMGAAFSAASDAPIIGHGFGVPYYYYSLVYRVTHETTFVHNGYLGLFYRHGLIGLVLFGGFFGGTLLLNARALIRKALPVDERVFSIFTLAVFTSIALSANSESPFGAMDKTLMMGFVAAAGAGTLQRHRSSEASSDQKSL